MPVITYDLPFDQGADFSLQWTWNNGPDNGPQTPVNLSGCTANMQVWQDVTDGAPILSVTTTASAAGSIALGGTEGTILVNIVNASVSALPLNRVTFGIYVYVLYITFSNGQVVDYARGQVTKVTALGH